MASRRTPRVVRHLGWTSTPRRSKVFSRWWFQRCFIVTPTWGNDPIWLNAVVWGFPKIGVQYPPNHPLKNRVFHIWIGFSIIFTIYLGVFLLFLETPNITFFFLDRWLVGRYTPENRPFAPKPESLVKKKNNHGFSGGVCCFFQRG